MGLSRFHRLVQIGGIAVHPAVYTAPQILFGFGVHQLHGSQGRAQNGQKVCNGLALLKVGHITAASGSRLGGKLRLRQQGQQFPIHRHMGGGQFQVIALIGVGHRAAGQKGPSEKSGAAVVLLQHPKVDVMGQSLSHVIAKGQ